MRISVIIPTYDRRDLLEAALASVAAQTRPADEVLVVDDGSSDDTVAWLEREAPWVHLQRQDRKGPAAARNRAAAAATGDWLALLDSDDLWEPNKLERMEQAILADGTTRFAYSETAPIDFEGAPLSAHQKPRHSGWVTEQLFASVFVHTSTVMLERSLLEEVGGFPEDFITCQDYVVWLRSSLLTPFLFVDEVLARRRIHPESHARGGSPDRLVFRARCLEEFASSAAARDRLSPDVVSRRLARAHLTAARACLRLGRFDEAREQASMSLSHRPFSPRAAWFWLRSNLRRASAG